jgi:hypothetical protein
MRSLFSERSLLDELEARQEEVLQQLDELNERLELLLRQHSTSRPRELPQPALAAANG